MQSEKTTIRELLISELGGKLRKQASLNLTNKKRQRTENWPDKYVDLQCEAKIQVHKLKQFNQKQTQELRQILDIQDRLQRTAAEMNTLRLGTNASVETLSQQLSQMPADLSGCQSQDRRCISPAHHRTKRSRFDNDPMDPVSLPQVALRDNVNLANHPEEEREAGEDICHSITQDENEASNRMRKPLNLNSEIAASVFEEQAI